MRTVFGLAGIFALGVLAAGFLSSGKEAKAVTIIRVRSPRGADPRSLFHRDAQGIGEAIDPSRLAWYHGGRLRRFYRPAGLG